MKFKKKPEILSEQEKISKEILAKNFIEGAEYNKSKKENITIDTDSLNEDEIKDGKPWRKLDKKNSKNITVFSLRIPKEEMLQLKFLSKETIISINSICLTALRQYLKKEIKEILDEKNS